MEHDRRSKASTVNSMRTEPRTFGSVSRASINRAGSLGSSYMLPERPPSPLPYDSSPRRLLSPGVISPSPSPPRRSLTYQHHPYDEVPRSDRGETGNIGASSGGSGAGTPERNTRSQASSTP